MSDWSSNRRWSASGIRSSAGIARWIMLGFALFWNLVTLPVFFKFGELWQQVQQEPATAFIFLFPLIGLLLLGMCVRTFRQWHRFGPTPLVLDPFPGAIGGHVGGRIETRIPFAAGQRFDVTLSSIYSYMSGSGKNRSRSEKILWQNEGVCHSERRGPGTELAFRFDVPPDLLPTDYPRGSRYHLWRVSVSCELEGPDFSRQYEIPVLPTGESSSLTEGTEAHAATVDDAMEGIEDIARIKSVAGGIEAWFPPFQRPAQGIVGLLFGLTFAVIGALVGQADAPLIFPLLFIPVGLLIAAWGLFYLGKALLVSVTRDGLRTRRFLFGWPVTTKSLARADVAGLDIEQGATMQTGTRTTVYYRLYAKGRHGQRFPVAERLDSRAEAELLLETFETYLSS